MWHSKFPIGAAGKHFLRIFIFIIKTKREIFVHLIGFGKIIHDNSIVTLQNALCLSRKFK